MYVYPQHTDLSWASQLDGKVLHSLCQHISVQLRIGLQGYAEGNLCWKAAFEAKYAWMSVSQKDAERRADWDPTATIHEAAEEWGQNAVRIVQQFCEESGAAVPKSILDVGCSTGYSSRNLRQKFPETSITGVDASPYFVAVAETEEKCAPASSLSQT